MTDKPNLPHVRTFGAITIRTQTPSSVAGGRADEGKATSSSSLDNTVRLRVEERERKIAVRKLEMNTVPNNCKEHKDNIRYKLDSNVKALTFQATEPNYDFEIGPCNHRGCKCCAMWSHRRTDITALYNGKKVQCNLTREATCATQNVVYALVCTECEITYVGETKQRLGTRISAHRRNIESDKENTHMVNHFRHQHKRVIQPNVRILETLPITATKNDRLTAEMTWTLALNTVFPWGLNTNVKGYGAIATDTDPAERRNCPWFQHRYQRPLRKGYKHKHKNRKDDQREHSTRDILDKFCRMGTNLLEKYRFLSERRIADLNRISELALGTCQGKDFVVYQQIASFLLAHHAPKHIEAEKPIFIPFSYVNRFSGIFDPAKLLKTRRCYPPGITKSQLPKVIFTKSYGRTSGSHLLNYNKFLKNLDDAEIRNILEAPCLCDKEELKCHADRYHGHVCTGDLSIVKNHIVRTLMSKGTRFRQTTDDSIEAAALECMTSVQNFIRDVVTKSHPELAAQFYSAMHSEMTHLHSKCMAYKKKNVLSQIQDFEKTQKECKELKKRFVITPVDKAGSNFALTCPKFYILTLNNELGVRLEHNGLTFRGNDTYVPADVDKDTLIDRHNAMTQRVLGIPVSEENRCLPRLWACPKFHKNPIKFRFIAGARLCSTKQLSVTLTKILQGIKSHWIRYTAVVGERKNVRLNWSIADSGEVIRMLKRERLPDNNKLTIADFSTLYTSFEHKIILSCMTSLVDKMFKHSGHKYLSIGKIAFYHSSESRAGRKYTKTEVMELIHFMVGNSYVEYGEHIFHQRSGIPMGANFAPVLADLSLSYMEYNYLIAHPGDCARIKFTTRYIDDILTVGSTAMLELAQHIYPQSLPLSFDDTTKGTGHYLDLSIDRNNKTIGLYDKRNDFRFTVIRFTDALSNVPRQDALNVLYSQVIRVARICTNKDELRANLAELANQTKSKGFAMIEVHRTMDAVRKRYLSLFRRHQLSNAKDFAQALRLA